MVALDWLYYILLLILCVVGLFINILGLPGLWLMVAAYGAFWWATASRGYVGVWSAVTIIVLALLAELVEFLAGAAGSKAAGGSKRGMAGAIIGGIVGGLAGTPLLPVVGTIVGACLGSFIGAFVIELAIGRTHEDSLKIGVGAAKGRFMGIVAKLAFGIAILFVALICAIPTGRTSASTPVVAAPTTLPFTQPATTQSTQPTTNATVEQ
jgi:uncharacterized protein YqgC (DUF456 family)